MKRPRSSAAFTVVELIVVMVLLTLVMGAAYLVMGGGVRQSGQIERHIEVNRALRFLVSTMKRDLRASLGYRLLEVTGDGTLRRFEFMVCTDDEPVLVTYEYDADEGCLRRNGYPVRVEGLSYVKIRMYDAEGAGIPPGAADPRRGDVPVAFEVRLAFERRNAAGKGRLVRRVSFRVYSRVALSRVEEQRELLRLSGRR